MDMYGNGDIYGTGKKVGITLILLIGFVASASGAPNPTCLSSEQKQTIEMLVEDKPNVTASDVENIFRSQCQRDTTFYSILQDDQDEFLNQTEDMVDSKLETAKNDMKVYVNEETSLGRVTRFLQGLNTTIQSQRELDDQIDSLEKTDTEIKKDIADYYVRQSELNNTQNRVEELESEVQDIDTTETSSNSATGMFGRTTTQFWGVLALAVVGLGGLAVASPKETRLDQYWEMVVDRHEAKEMDPEKAEALQNVGQSSNSGMKSTGKLSDEREAQEEEETEKIQTFEIDGEKYTEDGIKRLKENLVKEKEELKSKGATRSGEEDQRLEDIQDKISAIELSMGQ